MFYKSGLTKPSLVWQNYWTQLPTIQRKSVHCTSKYQPIYLIQSKNQQVNRCKIKEERYGVSLMKSDLESNKLVSNTFRMIWYCFAWKFKRSLNPFVGSIARRKRICIDLQFRALVGLYALNCIPLLNFITHSLAFQAFIRQHCRHG